MAAAHVQHTPRAASAAGGLLIKMPNLPTIEHPMARLGDKSELTVRGQSRLGGSRREKTFVTMSCDGQAHLGLDRDNLPTMSCGRTRGKSGSRVSESQRIITWPPEHLARFGEGRPRRSTDPSKQRPEQLENVIRDKLTTGYYGLKHMFRGNDPNGHGVVSREALLKILYSVCGYISNEQYSKLLKRLHLEGKPSISFDDFINCFKDHEIEQKEWLSPVARQNYYLQPEAHLRHPVFLRTDDFISSTFCYSLIKDRAKMRNFNARDFLPPACFETDGVVVPPQLREMAALLGYHLRDEEFTKLWERFDLQGTGAVQTEEFFRHLGLDRNGLPKSVPLKRPNTVPAIPTQSPAPPSGQREKTEIPSRPESKIPSPTKDDEEEETREKGEQEIQNDTKEERVMTSRRPKTRSRKSRVVLDSVLDSLRFRCEEGYQALLQGFQHFDFMKDGYITRIDFKTVLSEYGMPIAAIDMESLLARCSIRSIRGQLNYKEFLTKFMNRSDTGIVARVASNRNHTFAKDTLGEVSGDNLTVDELETALVEFLHSPFLQLLATFRKHDKYDIGLVTQYECRSAVERVIGCSVTDKQWEELKSQVGTDADGLIPYAEVLDLLNISPGSWNKRKEGNHWVSKVNQSEPCAEAERCAEQAAADRQRAAKDALKMERDNRLVDPGRSSQELKEVLIEFFRVKFHSIDKTFKDLDKKKTGLCSKHQFAYILKQCGCELTAQELDRLWDSVCVNTDGLCNYVSLVRHFLGHTDRLPPPITGKLPMEDDTELLETARKVQKQRKQEQKYDKVNGVLSKTDGVSGSQRDHLLEKIKAQVMNNLDNIKSFLKSSDQEGYATVPIYKVQEMMRKFNFNLTEEESDKLCSSFDLNKNGNFHYMEFMQTLTGHSNQNGYTNQPVPIVYSKMSHKLEKKQTLNSAGSWGRVEHPTVAMVIERMRVKLIKDYKSIRRAFKKLDTGRTGYLHVHDFKAVLKSCNINVGPDDLYHILAEFDTNMDGRISYQEFLSQLLSME